MHHHLKKEFTQREITFIEIMFDRKKPIAYIAKELGCWYYRVKKEINKLKNKTHEQAQVSFRKP